MILSLMTEKELEILDFSCNQFGHQAPGTNEEIHTFCKGPFGIQFLQYGKIEVNGENVKKAMGDIL